MFLFRLVQRLGRLSFQDYATVHSQRSTQQSRVGFRGRSAAAFVVEIDSAHSPGAIANSDQDFVIPALDNDNPNKYFGPSLLDRPQQFSFGVVGSLPHDFQISVIGHFYSSLPLPIIVPGSGTAQIFMTDFTGDGTTGNPLPGTLNGAFGRQVHAGGLNNLLTQYNNTLANQPTPAGATLVNNGLFTVSQLQQLGAVAPTATLAPNGQQNMGSLRSFDLKLSWTYRIEAKGHIIQLQPGFGFFNLFNFANFDLPPNALAGALTGSAGTINGTTAADRITNRVGAGTGVFNLGAPRAMEFGMSISF